MSETYENKGEVEDAIRKLKGGTAVVDVITAWSERHQAWLTMVCIADEWGGGSCNGTGISEMQALVNGLQVAKILLNARPIPA